MATADPSVARPAQRRIAALLVLIAGVFLVVVTFANNLFGVGPAFENLITDFRPALSQQSIATARQDLTGLQAVGDEFQNKLAPQLAAQMGQTPEQFNAFVQQQFPDVAKGMAALPAIVPQFNGLITTLDQQRPLFASADAIPTSNLPATTVPWGLLALGVLMMVAGVLMWVTRRLGSWLAIVLGVVVVLASVLLTLPTKAADADQLNANLQPVYTKTLVDNAKGALTTMSAMGQQMQQDMLPALAQQLNMQPEQLQGFLQQNFPATAAALTSMPQTLARFQALVTTFDANLGNYDVLKPVDFTMVIWMMLGAGIAVLLFGAWGVFAALPRHSPHHVIHPEMPSGIAPVA